MHYHACQYSRYNSLIFEVAESPMGSYLFDELNDRGAWLRAGPPASQGYYCGGPDRGGRFWGSIGRGQQLVMSVRSKNGAAEVWARVLVNRRPTSGKSWGIVGTNIFHQPRLVSLSA